MEEQKKKILVALSGGVDSSVSTALLQEQGHEVETAFIKTWSPDWLPCTWREERRDAMRVAAHLGVPFHTVDLSKEYEHDVVQYLVREYKAGRTPNPDVMCNKYVKFGGLFDWAMQKGFDAIATGHYAQVKKEGNTYELHKGVDNGKDQSYFLWTLTQEQLAKTFFPVGGYQKSEVRTIAVRFDLPTAQKKDSQGVCFLGKLNMKEFLEHYIDTEPGAVLDTEGNEIGVHDGAVFLTLGQRHGFRITRNGTDDTPRYVVAKDIEKNTVTVAPKELALEEQSISIPLADVHWIAGIPKETVPYTARLRYRQTLFEVTLESVTESTVTIVPKEPQRYIPKGQSLVVYDNDVCVGGGIIA